MDSLETLMRGISFSGIALVMLDARLIKKSIAISLGGALSKPSQDVRVVGPTNMI